ncbi:MAG TPA: DMSO reductase [Coriobacteriia bacterium]|nr:DMSO reductase [Coriobacteriia bacterium]
MPEVLPLIELGLQTALSEITLVLFTTFAPAGVFAFMVVGVYLIFAKLDSEQRHAISLSLILSNVITLVGLVASATHLGNPANALYVFMRVGQSPLSTEVFCMVVFLLFAGVFWLYSFSLKPKVLLQKIWMGVTVVLGAIAITSIAFAYNVSTISTWNTVFVPINLWLNALVGGSIMALLTLQLGKAPGFATSKTAKGLCALAAVALVANAVSMVLQDVQLPTLTNAFGSAAELVPFYKIVIVAFVVLVATGLFIYGPRLYHTEPHLPGLTLACVANFVVLLGIFLTRFSFYMMHMTVGLAI